MKLINKVLIIVIIFLVIFTIYFNCIRENEENSSVVDIENYIHGYWTSDNNFAKISDIDDMILNIDVENLSGFLIIIIDKEINDSDEFILKIDKIQSKKNKCGGVYNEFEIEFLTDDEDFIWYDKKFKAILSIDDGSLKLFHNDTLYANLFKDNKMSYLLK